MRQQLKAIINYFIKQKEEQKPSEGECLVRLIEERNKLEKMVLESRGDYLENLQRLVELDEKIFNLFRENGREIDLSRLNELVS